MLVLVLAGGRGERLGPLTTRRAKPALPFGPTHRLIDFVLASAVNSGVRDVYVLAQYRADSLLEHVKATWSDPCSLAARIVPLTPGSLGARPFAGTADAVHQALALLDAQHPDFVAVLAADHVYRMDLGSMLRAHLAGGADMTVATVPVPRVLASAFGVATTDADGMVRDFVEKPSAAAAAPLAGDATRSLASMGNYLFRSDVLIDALEEANHHGETDFGHHVLPRLIKRRRVLAYDFSRRGDGESLPGWNSYWRDVGTVRSYLEAHQELLGATPAFSLDQPGWPLPPARPHRAIDGSLLADDALVDGARVTASVLRPGVVVEPGARVEHCVLLDGVRVGRGAHLRHCVADEGAYVPAGASVWAGASGLPSGAVVSDGNIVVLTAGTPGSSARDGRH